MRRVTRLLVLILLLLGSTAIATAAQDGTPPVTADGFPIVADPALCTVEPRDPGELLDLWFPASATPAAAIEDIPTAVTIPLGTPIGSDESVFAGITLTVQEVLACFSAGDFPRATALFTDELVASFGQDFGPEETRQVVGEALLATPVPEVGAEPVVLLAITDAMLLDDGRVGAFVVSREVQGEEPVTETVYVIFEQGGGRWLVDEVIEFAPVAGNEG